MRWIKAYLAYFIVNSTARKLAKDSKWRWMYPESWMLLEKLLAIVPETSLNISMQGNGYGNMNTPFRSHIVPTESATYTAGVLVHWSCVQGKKY